MINFDEYIGKEVISISTVETNDGLADFGGYMFQFDNYNLVFYGLIRENGDFSDCGSVSIFSNRKDMKKIINGKIKSISAIQNDDELGYPEYDNNKMRIDSIYRIETNKGNIDIIFRIDSNMESTGEFYIEELSEPSDVNKFSVKKLF